MSIPKVIHYCWFGKNQEPELMQQCIESWKKYLPDYELVLWNEDSFDINSNLFVKEAYQEKKWAFVSDYVRLYALKHHGGLYMDTDVEVLKNLDSFLSHDAFSGYDNDTHIPTGIMGAFKEHPWIELLIGYYEDLHFINTDGTLNTKTNAAIITEMTTQHYDFDYKIGYQELKDGLIIYPKDYFCPKSYYDGEIRLTDNTHTIHHFNGSWHSRYDRFRLILHKLFINIFGKRLHDWMLDRKHGRSDFE